MPAAGSRRARILEPVAERRVAGIRTAADDAAQPCQHRFRERGQIRLGYLRVASCRDLPCRSSARRAPS